MGPVTPANYEELLLDDETMKAWAVGHSHTVDWDSVEAVEEFRSTTWSSHLSWKAAMWAELEAMKAEDA